MEEEAVPRQRASAAELQPLLQVLRAVRVAHADTVGAHVHVAGVLGKQ